MSKLSLIHSTQKAGPNTEIYGPRSEYGFLRTARRPIRMQDSSKPYNKTAYSYICVAPSPSLNASATALIIALTKLRQKYFTPVFQKYYLGNWYAGYLICLFFPTQWAQFPADSYKDQKSLRFIG